MSNIDKLKSAAAKAVDNFDPNMFVETRDVLALMDELEAKDKRIADLEARKVRVNLPRPGFMTTGNHGFAKNDVLAACREAGIKLEVGE